MHVHIHKKVIVCEPKNNHCALHTIVVIPSNMAAHMHTTLRQSQTQEYSGVRNLVAQPHV